MEHSDGGDFGFVAGGEVRPGPIANCIDLTHHSPLPRLTPQLSPILMEPHLSPRSLSWLVPVAALLISTVMPGHAAERETRLQAELSYGYDSNPLELTDEVPLAGRSPSAAGFAQVSLDSRHSHQWNPRAGFFVAAAGRARSYGSSLEDADTSQGRVEAGLGMVLAARGERRLSAALRASYGKASSTFVDPATGEVYAIADPNSRLEIPDRFDSDVVSLNLDLRLRVSRNLLFMLDSGLQRSDYADDYDRISTLEPLDDRSYAFRPGARWQISPRVRLDLTAELGGTRYDELPALESDATTAVGTRRRYRSSGLRSAVRVDPTGALSFSLGVDMSDREDLHAGYYDASGIRSFLSAAWQPVERTRIALHISQASFDYERAVIDPTTNSDVRGGDRLRVVAGLERELHARLVLFGEGGSVRSDNEDPLYSFDRNWALAGLRFRL